MLTSLYYYGHYKPYLYSTDISPRSKKIGKTKNENISRFSGIDTKDYLQSNPDNSAYFLNYSDKQEVKNAVSAISYNVNAVKDTVRYLQNVKRGRNARLDGGKSAYGDALEDFAGDLNSLSEFAKGKSVSSDLKNFDRKVKDAVYEKSGLMNEFGINSDGDKAEFNRSVYDKLSFEEYNEKSEQLNEVFSDIYDYAVDVLQKPLSTHLNFKNLDYYYNYSYSTKSKEPLGFIDTGLVVDIIL